VIQVVDTDEGGFASFDWTPTEAGDYTITAEAQAIGAPAPVTFTATVTSSPVINFETLPDGSPSCGGDASCPVTTQFLSRGVEFIFSQVPGSGGATPFLCRTPFGPDGEGSNYGVSPAILSGCSSWYSGVVTMRFAGHPTTVEFQVEGNASTGSVFPASAIDAAGNGVTVTQTSVFTYSPAPGLTFRREGRRATSPNGIAMVQVDSDGAVRFIDNLLLITPVIE
jgi:hypothetical protein